MGGTYIIENGVVTFLVRGDKCKASSTPRSANRPRPSVDCPICYLAVVRLAKHLRKCHSSAPEVPVETKVVPKPLFGRLAIGAAERQGRGAQISGAARLDST